MILTVFHSIVYSVELLKRQGNQIVEELTRQFIILLLIPRLEDILLFNGREESVYRVFSSFFFIRVTVRRYSTPVRSLSGNEPRIASKT